MSEKKRDSKAIVQESHNLALKAGYLQYEAAEKTKEVAMLNQAIAALATEYAKAKAEEDAAAKTAEEAGA